MPHVPADDRRQALVEAAITVMTRDGVRAATTRRIVEEAGASLAAFHYCFRSKDELIGEVIARTNDEFLSWHRTPSPEATTPREALELSIRGLWSITRDFPERQAMLFELTQYASRDAKLAELSIRQYADYYETWVQFFAALEERFTLTPLKPREAIARFTVSFIDGLNYNYLLDRELAAAEMVVELGIDALCAQFSSTVGTD